MQFWCGPRVGQLHPIVEPHLGVFVCNRPAPPCGICSFSFPKQNGKCPGVGGMARLELTEPWTVKCNFLLSRWRVVFLLQILKLSAVLVYDGPEIRQKSLKQTAIFSCCLLALTEHMYICARYRESSITLDPLCFFVIAYVVTVIFKKKAKRKVSNNKTKNKETLFTMTKLFTSC